MKILLRVTQRDVQAPTNLIVLILKILLPNASRTTKIRFAINLSRLYGVTGEFIAVFVFVNPLTYSRTLKRGDSYLGSPDASVLAGLWDVKIPDLRADCPSISGLTSTLRRG